MRWQGETDDMMMARWRAGVRCFAILPHMMHDGKWVWLEWHWRAWVPSHSGNGFWRNALTREDAIPREPKRVRMPIGMGSELTMPVSDLLTTPPPPKR